MEYNEEDYLMLSGLQHFRFCRRQWALIHIENQWEENYRTIDGKIVHENAHDQSFTESRGDIIITRGVNVFSRTLGVSGQCDVLEYHRDENGYSLNGKEGKWRPYPVEYKRGTPATGEGNALQLCAQAMCLEEMLCCEIQEGALYYFETRHRVKIAITDEMRDTVRKYSAEMHEYFDRQYLPRPKRTKACNACSLKEECLPKLEKIQSAKAYNDENLGREMP